jgi:hypothetical protein
MIPGIVVVGQVADAETRIGRSDPDLGAEGSCAQATDQQQKGPGFTGHGEG